MSKKWYSFFVVTDAQEGTAEAPPPAAPRRAASEAPDPATTAAIEASAVEAGAIADVYASARIEVPAHGYTVLKIADMLRSEHIRALPADVKRKSIMVALDAAGVSVDEIVQDAVRRDQALDTYERVLERHLEQVQAEKAADNARIEEEIARLVADLRGRIEENTREVERERAELTAWQTRKQQEESTIAEAVGYFVTENPVTGSSPTEAAKGDADVR